MRPRGLLPLPALLIAAAIILLLLITSDADGRAPAAKIIIVTADRAQVRATICQVFGDRCRPALRVAYCETGGTYDPRALGAAGERGIFQLHPIHFSWLDERRLYEPAYNARAAFRLSRGGRDWTPWSCRP